MQRRPRLTPAIADIRRAVREQLTAITETDTAPLYLVALSGGADSLALAAATAFVAPRIGARAGAIIIDHQLQEGSAQVAKNAATQARDLGLDPVVIKKVSVSTGGGPEAAARTARYAALKTAQVETGAKRILIAHTLDDQAETVLLGLARGSGAASLQGMLPDTGDYLRPLLAIRRETTRSFCADSALDYWSDPQNFDEQYTRVRLRQKILPMLEKELGPGIAAALARTAEQLREDNQAFEQQIAEVIEDIVEPADAGIAVSVSALAANPAALRQRIIRYVVLHEFGVSLHRSHTLEVAKLVTDWRGQSALNLPGVAVQRVGSYLYFQAPGADATATILPHDH